MSRNAQFLLRDFGNFRCEILLSLGIIGALLRVPLKPLKLLCDILQLCLIPMMPKGALLSAGCTPDCSNARAGISHRMPAFVAAMCDYSGGIFAAVC